MHSPRPTISVVIPVKDDADVLIRCLAALAAQSVRADEVVVVDNGSVDASAEVAAAAGARVVSRPGGGIPAASAAGYDEARFSLIARLDADCIPGPDWLAAMIEVFDSRPDVVAVTGGAHFIDGPRRLRRPLAVVYLGAYFAFVGVALGHLPVFGSNFAMRSSAWADARAEVHRHDPVVHDDLDLSFHLTGRIVYRSGLDMGMSMRPFTSIRSFGFRLRRGMHTVTSHWPDELPPYRLWRAVRRAGSTPAGGGRTITR